MSVSDQAPEASALYQPLRFWNNIPSVSWGCKILDGALSVNLNVILQQFVVTSTHLHLQKVLYTYQIQTHMNIAKYLPWNPMSHHFSYAALTLCLRFPSFGLREGNCQKTLTRSLRRSHWIIFDSRSTTRAYAKSLTCYAAVSSESEEEENDEEWDWLSTWGIVQRKFRKKFTTVIPATASRTLGQSAHILHKTLERFRSWRHGLWVKVGSFAYEWLTRSLGGNLYFFYNTEHTKKKTVYAKLLTQQVSSKKLTPA